MSFPWLFPTYPPPNGTRVGVGDFCPILQMEKPRPGEVLFLRVIIYYYLLLFVKRK